MKLVAIGLLAGFFSALFGVGGGIVTRHGGTYGSPMSPLLPSLTGARCAIPGKARHRDVMSASSPSISEC